MTDATSITTCASCTAESMANCLINYCPTLRKDWIYEPFDKTRWSLWHDVTPRTHLHILLCPIHSQALQDEEVQLGPLTNPDMLVSFTRGREGRWTMVETDRYWTGIDREWHIFYQDTLETVNIKTEI